LAEGQLEIPADPLRWLDTQVLNVERERMKSATLTQPAGETLRVSKSKREDANFTVHDLPAGKELKYPGAGDGVGSALSALTFEDVAPIETIDFDGKSGGKPGNYAEFRTFDGLMVATQLVEKDGKTWAKFVAYSEAAPGAEAPKPDGAAPTEAAPAGKKPEDVKKEADELNARLGRWAFALPTWKVTAFNAQMTDMIKTDQPPAPPPGMEGTAPLFPQPETPPANPAPKGP
jgi:hypothetical protein